MTRNRNGRTFAEVIEGSDADLTFNDITFVDRCSEVETATLRSRLTPKIELNLPIVSSPMDDVTEAKLAIAMALHGALGIIHYNLAPKEAAAQVRKVKRHKMGFISEPLCRRPTHPISEVHEVKKAHGFSTILITEDGTPETKLLGMVTMNDVLLETDTTRELRSVMTRTQELRCWGYIDHLPTIDEVRKFFRDNPRVQKLPIISTNTERIIALVTRRDLADNTDYPNALTGANEELLVGAAIRTRETLERVDLLVQAGVDVLCIDTAVGGIHAIRRIREIKGDTRFQDIEIIAGNVSSPAQALHLLEAGADVIRIGAGPGSICKTSNVHRSGRGQLSATWDTFRGIQEHQHAHPQTARPFSLITDGGIGGMGDAMLSFACGASAVMLGRLLAGTDEASSPFLDNGLFKRYRGMGSLEAMRDGAASRYDDTGTFSDDEPEEGVVSKVPAIGSVHKLLRKYRASLRKNLITHLGCSSITDLQEAVALGAVRCVRHSPASARERSPHDIVLL